VPCVECREVPCTKTVYDTCSVEIPYEVCRTVPEVRFRDVQYTVCRSVPVPETRTEIYRTSRVVPEQRFQTVNTVVRRMVPETGFRKVPKTTWHEIPITRTVSVPRQVPRTVLYNVTRCIPRTETCQIPVKVCCPPLKGKKCGCGGDAQIDGDVPRPLPPVEGEPELAIPPEADPDTATPPEVDTVIRSDASNQLHHVSHDIAKCDVSEASRLFQVGLDDFRQGRWEPAAARFQDALDVAPWNAKYAYYQAVALHLAGRGYEASRALTIAVELEKQTPITDWGKSMQRVQGRPRIWLEDTRKMIASAL
jgi:hypothetical protein